VSDAITLAGVSKSFGAVPVLDSVNLTVPQGQRTVIVGTSGSGKTTLLRLMSGFERPDRGTITISGHQVAGEAGMVPAHQRGVGYVSQDGALFPHLTVGQNIRFGLKGTGRRQRDGRVGELLEMVSLDPGLAVRRPDELSGGQQQRVALARSLARQPGIMLLDEPFSALDSGLRSATRDLVAQTLQTLGVTTVLVTHDRAEALSFADQLAVLRDGRLVQVGTPQALYASPADLFTASFLGDTVIVEAVLDSGEARCALGTVPVSSPLVGPARLMWRPEQLIVSTTRDRGVGEVTALDFQGAETVLTVVLDGVLSADRRAAGSFPPTTVQIRQPSLVAGTVGDRVDISWNGQQPVTFPDDESGRPDH